MTKTLNQPLAKNSMGEMLGTQETETPGLCPRGAQA